MSITASGVLQLEKNGTGFLRNPARSFQKRDNDVFVSRELIRRLGLPEGVYITGSVANRRGKLEIKSVSSCNGIQPGEFRNRTRFNDLVTISPDDRFFLGAAGDISMRMIDLLAPVGKGTRGLIVSPPRAGKTMLLENMARGIRKSHPSVRVIVLLIDERPEEVTHFRRAVDAEVYASSNDEFAETHVSLVKLIMSHVKCELESGRDIVLLVDSLTRMARAFNLTSEGRGRTMSGGVEAGALEIPRRFFGLARNIEDGGSVTVVATTLVDTGSKMDQLIFEEFKGTGNSELVLDRNLANQRIWPAINIEESGTRREELLLAEEELRCISRIRRDLAGMQPAQAVPMLRDQLEKYETNAEFILSVK